MRSFFFSLFFLLLVGAVQVSCLTADKIASPASSVKHEASNDDSEYSSAVSEESRRQSLVKCGTSSVSELILGMGLGIAVPHFLVWPSVSLFIAGEFAECFLLRRSDKPKAVYTRQIERSLEEKNRKQLEAIEQRLHRKILRRDDIDQGGSGEAQREIAEGIRTIKDLSRKERERIKKQTDKSLHDLYLEVEMFKNTKIVIDEEIIDDVTSGVK